MDYSQTIDQLDIAVRSGQISTVQKTIQDLDVEKIPHEHKASFADLSRRVRLEEWGLALLQPIIRTQTTTEHEYCTYAGLLIKVGALNEATKILSRLDEKKTLNTLVFRSQIAVAEWDYESASELLDRLLSLPNPDVYQKCVAQINLAAAFVYLQKFDRAESTLQIVRQECQKNNWDLLLGNALEITAQVAVVQKKWADAHTLLTEAGRHAGQHSHYLMFIQKWQAISDLMRADLSDPFSSELDQITARFQELRHKASLLNSWETIRDLDFHEALRSRHQNLLLNVYFGTPHYHYKKRIENIFTAEGWTVPPSYIRKISTSPAIRYLNLKSALEPRRTILDPLKLGDLRYRLLNVLATDFYKPRSVGDVFSSLFPDEYYKSETATMKCMQVVQQLQTWFILNEIPLNILVANNRYSLNAHSGYAFQIEKETEKVS